MHWVQSGIEQASERGRGKEERRERGREGEEGGREGVREGERKVITAILATQDKSSPLPSHSPQLSSHEHREELNFY